MGFFNNDFNILKAGLSTAGGAVGSIAGPVGGILGSAAGSLISNIFGSIFGKSNSKSLMNHQELLQRRQQSWIWQNQYAKTVAGMRMAGLNPAMSAGQQGPVTASMPSATMTNYTPVDASAIAQLAQLALLPSQQKINEATAANINADTKNKAADTTNKGLQGELMSNELFTWFESWQNQQALIGSQASNYRAGADWSWKQSALADKDIQKREEEIKYTMELTKNLFDIRQQIKTQTGLIASQKEGQDKANAKYDQYMDNVIHKIETESTSLSHEDKRQEALILKRLVNLDFTNENLLYQQDYLKTMRDVQDWQLYLDRVYGQGDRWLNQVNQVLQAAQSGAKTAYGFRGNISETITEGPNGRSISTTTSKPFWQW